MSEFGELLRHARAYKGVTLREAERATRISRQYLLALEHEEFGGLPALTYARGIVRKYAEYLGLDPVAILARFEDIHGQRSGGFRVVPAVKPLDVSSHWAPNFAIIAFMVVMAAVIFAWMYSAYFAPVDTLPTPTASTLGTRSETVTSVVIATTPTVIYSEGGGEATVTPKSEPEPTAAPTADVTPEPEFTSTVETAADGVHWFEVAVTEEVWVEVTIDGEVVHSSTVEAGESIYFEGEQMHVLSGNAAFVFVGVDGVSYGALGPSWDSEQTYPIE